MGEHNPARTALSAILRGQGELDLGAGDQEREDPVEDLVGLTKLDASRSLVAGNAGKGRPRGVHSYKTERWIRYITGRFGSPVEGMMQIAALPLEALAKELGCSRLDALREKRACWAAAAPFVHPKLSTVEIKPVGSPAGDPVDLPFAAEIEGEVVDVEPSASPAGEQLEGSQTHSSMNGSANSYCAPLARMDVVEAPADPARKWRSRR
jgi:hypothetical protein